MYIFVHPHESRVTRITYIVTGKFSRHKVVGSQSPEKVLNCREKVLCIRHSRHPPLPFMHVRALAGAHWHAQGLRQAQGHAPARLGA